MNLVHAMGNAMKASWSAIVVIGSMGIYASKMEILIRQQRNLWVSRTLSTLVYLKFLYGKMTFFLTFESYSHYACSLNLWLMWLQSEWVQLRLCESNAQFMCGGSGMIWVCFLLNSLWLFLFWIYLEKCLCCHIYWTWLHNHSRFRRMIYGMA